MAAHIEEKPGFTSPIETTLTAAETIADAFFHFPAEQRPLAAFLFVELTRLALEVSAPAVEASETDFVRRQSEECRKAADLLRELAGRAVLPPPQQSAVDKAASDFVGLKETDASAFGLPYRILKALALQIEVKRGAGIERVKETVSLRLDREGLTALMFAAAFDRIYRAQINEDFCLNKARSERIAAAFRAVLDDEDLRSFAYAVTEGLLGITGRHAVTAFCPALSSGDPDRVQRNRVFLLQFTAMTGLGLMTETSDDQIRHADEDDTFFAGEGCEAVPADRISAAVIRLKAEDRNAFVEAVMSECIILQNILTLPDAERERFVGKPDVPETVRLLNAVQSFLLIGRALSDSNGRSPAD